MKSNITLEVSIDEQRLHVFSNNILVKTYPVSTSTKGMGCQEGSYRTPTGHFRIAEKIGEQLPIRTAFVKRIPQGEWNGEYSPKDMILSRILRLDGLEEQNANSFTRYIYIHGTNHEHLIGQPVSHGCIRMKNTDVAELFNQVSVDDELVIYPMNKKKHKLLFIDCDSTLSAIEGIDELARLSSPKALSEVEALTHAAMDGKIPLDEVFKKRMEIIQPTQDFIDQVAQMYIDRIVPGAQEWIDLAQRNAWLPIILSGGFAPVIQPLAEILGIKHIEAVPLYFDPSGNYQGYGENYPTTRNHGKNEIIQEWKDAMLPLKTLMIGDGISDLETKPDVDTMIGFGGVVERNMVKSNCNQWITDFKDPSSQSLLY